MIGTQFAGKYKIIKKLGEGGMGSVYQAVQNPIDRMVAIKVLLGKLAQDEVAVKRFEQEARAVSKMQHPNTVTIFDYGTTDDDRLYIVMEFLRGKTLSDALRASAGGIEERRTIHIIRQVCASLGDAHAAGIIHRDLKPDNIFLTEMGGSKDWVKVLDFGVAKMADAEGASTLTQTGMIFGTPKYMSPEQAEGKPIDFRADIYAIGVVMYELLTGRPPFLADTPVALLLKHIAEQPRPFRVLRPDIAVSPEIEAIVMKSLAKAPDDRYSSVEQLSADLEACASIVRGTAPHMVAELGTQPAGVVSRPVPTEVNPGQGARLDLSPADLRPPNVLPSGLSLGLNDVRRAPTEPAPPMMPTGQTGVVPPGPPTGATGVAPNLSYRPDPSTMAFGSSITPNHTTGPVHAAGGVETLGGVGDLDLSRGLRAPEKKKAPVLLIGGAVAAAAAMVIWMAVRPADDVVVSRPLEPSASPSSVPVTPAPSAAAIAAPTPAPTTEPTITPAPSATPTPGATAAADPRVRRTPVPTAEAVVKAPRITLRFDSVPSGAIVELDAGEQLGRTPFQKEFLQGPDVVQVVFRLAGHQSKAQIFSLASDRSIKVELEKEAAAAVPEASATPRPTPTAVARPTATPKPSPTATATDDKVDDLK
jgi:serine/threonine protein kinase